MKAVQCVQSRTEDQSPGGRRQEGRAVSWLCVTWTFSEGERGRHEVPSTHALFVLPSAGERWHECAALPLGIGQMLRSYDNKPGFQTPTCVCSIMHLLNVILAFWILDRKGVMHIKSS